MTCLCGHTDVLHAMTDTGSNDGPCEIEGCGCEGFRAGPRGMGYPTEKEIDVP
jgi:hypothetical protein